jgi:hypothetical protein
MKPTELIKSDFEKLTGLSAEVRMLRTYLQDESVVAYIQNCLGSILLIRGQKGFIGFLITNKRIRGYSVYRTSLRGIAKLLTTECEKDRLHITNPELWGRFLNRIALMELDEKEANKDYRGDF